MLTQTSAHAYIATKCIIVDIVCCTCWLTDLLAVRVLAEGLVADREAGGMVMEYVCEGNRRHAHAAAADKLSRYVVGG